MLSVISSAHLYDTIPEYKAIKRTSLFFRKKFYTAVEEVGGGKFFDESLGLLVLKIYFLKS